MSTEPYSLLFIKQDLIQACKLYENFALHNGRFYAIFTVRRKSEGAMGGYV
jgi:hypothetical protein